MLRTATATGESKHKTTRMLWLRTQRHADSTAHDLLLAQLRHEAFRVRSLAPVLWHAT